MATPPYGGSPVPPSSTQPGGVWPPPTPGPYEYGEGANTSGQKGDVPSPISTFRWSWGAFILGWIWLLNHGLVLWGVLLLVLPFVLGWIPFGVFIVYPAVLVCHILLGINGHKLAWQNRRYEGGISQYLEVETAWKNWGIGFLVAWLLIIPILAALLFPVFAAAREKAREQALEHRSAQLIAPGPSVNRLHHSHPHIATFRSVSGATIRIEARARMGA